MMWKFAMKCVEFVALENCVPWRWTINRVDSDCFHLFCWRFILFRCTMWKPRMMLVRLYNVHGVINWTEWWLVPVSWLSIYRLVVFNLFCFWVLLSNSSHGNRLVAPSVCLFFFFFCSNDIMCRYIRIIINCMHSAKQKILCVRVSFVPFPSIEIEAGSL